MAGPERVDNMTRNGNLARWIAVLLTTGMVLAGSVVWAYSTFITRTEYNSIEKRLDRIEQKIDNLSRP